MRFCNDSSAHRLWINQKLSNNIEYEYLILDATIWQKAKDIFQKNKHESIIPVLDRNNRLVCFAWQDDEANRELRMLHELEMNINALDFHDLFPDIISVTIYGCNELAWYFAQYLQKRNIDINLEGEYWQEIGGLQSKECEYCSTKNYEVWAEGVHQKSENWKQERLRSASAEFECVDEIYEANIQAGHIADAEGDVEDLLSRLRNKEIILRGTGTKAQDAYDWLLANGIDICAFQSDRPQRGRKYLFGRPIKSKADVMEQYKDAVIVECAKKYSTWGFGDVDDYDYEGFQRNKQYLLLRDYIEIPESNLCHVLKGKQIVFIGDLRLCNRIYRWCVRQGMDVKALGGGYYDVLEENENKIEKFEIPKINQISQQSQEVVYMLVKVVYSANVGVAKEVEDKYEIYFEKQGVSNYTDYFSDMGKLIHLENEHIKYSRKELKPAGILLGAIPAHNGNVLFRQSLAGHPQIIVIEEYSLFNNDLYSICIRLAEEKADCILSEFWILMQELYDANSIDICFPDKDRFVRKMDELLAAKKYFTSQELFVMFHLAYETMKRDIVNLGNIVIYWEPHSLDRELVRDFAYWLESSDVKGFTICMTRNRYIRVGSCMKDYPAEKGWNKWGLICGVQDIKKKKIYKYWEEQIIKFEELKCKPEDTLKMICRWIGISFHNVLLKTTFRNEISYYDGDITGFDTKPAYNLYEEYFTSFDRLRICMVSTSYQKQYGYPYIACLDFSRRDLQEFFLKEFRWEALSDALRGKNEDSIMDMQKRVRKLLWRERFISKMNVELNEDY